MDQQQQQGSGSGGANRAERPSTSNILRPKSLMALNQIHAGGEAMHVGEQSFEDQIDRVLNYEIRIVTGNSNLPLAAEIAKLLRVTITEADVKRFSDGEVYVSIKENVRGKDVFILQSTSPPVNDHLMELLVIIDTLKRASAKRITAVIPYYGYARQDRKSNPRVPISARLVADLIVAAGAHRVLAFELHAGQIQGFFNIPVDHMFAIPVFAEYLLQLEKQPEDLVVVSPDAGGMERARALAKRLNAALAIIDKRRSGPNVAHVMHVIGDVIGKDCIIVDDMVDTAGTLCEGAKAVMDNGARRVRACCVHAVLSGPAIERLQNSPLERLYVTNSILLPDEKLIPKIRVLGVAQVFAETIRRIHREESVSSLFQE
ncbi:Ribose-phosphate pyrophosphokinase [Porphyridium purpureum]|uniref:ribose-phosphate diphosphokinase n=1 Tax=Porphyridium purpureum TaxID=35688 RepID=A0A5J4YJH6_PORPP|nr:Ribose-phosphate pyrophosphokinase [Porphyridium purpureum]|eukprot:POR9336..scf251_18